MPYWRSLPLVALMMVVVRWTSAQNDRRRDQVPFGRNIIDLPLPRNLPPTSTIPLYDCSDTHRPQQDNANQFQVRHNDRWWTQSCPDDLKWNQELCRCEYPGGDSAYHICRDYRDSSQGQAGKYEQFVNGEWIVRDCSLAVAGLVWDQTICQCVWGPGSSGKVTGQGITPCDIMLNMTFENGVKDEAKGSFVEVGHGEPLNTQPLGRERNEAAYFQGTALNLWFFSNNELGSSLRVEFQFKMDNTPDSRDEYQILMSNGCNVSVPGYTTPSLAIGFRPRDESYLLAFQTVNLRRAIVCSLRLGAYDWHTVSLIYEDGALLLRVDGQPCIVSQDFTGPVQITPCPLTIGADPLERTSMYQGYMDNIVIARYCRRFMDVELEGQGEDEAEDDRSRDNRIPENRRKASGGSPFSRNGDQPLRRFPR